MANTWNGIHAFQTFDAFNQYVISAAEARQDARRYDAVWGPRVGMPGVWKGANSSINVSYYLGFDTDLMLYDYGAQGHTVAWWQANHPSWVIYDCDSAGNPTHRPSVIGGLGSVVLDISNPDVVRYQMTIAGHYAAANGYTAIAADVLDLSNNTLHGGYYGCGIYTGSNYSGFVRKFSGRPDDLAWKDAVVQWVASAQALLHGLPHRLALIANNVPTWSPFGDPYERAVIDHLDILLDERGFSLYDAYLTDNQLLATVQWMQYAQSRGVGFFVIDNWRAEPTAQQLDFSIGTYLLGKQQAAALYTDAAGTYGEEHWYAQYDAPLGVPCAQMETPNADTFIRRFSGGFVAVNNSPVAVQRVGLPPHVYRSIEGGPAVKSPLAVAPHAAAVLLTTNGCR